MASSIGARLKALRQGKGYTLEYVGDIVGISKQTLYKYENGIITNIPSDKIEALAKLYSTTPGYIMGWDTGNGSAKYRMDFDDKSPMHALTQAFWRRPAIVQAEIIRRLEALDTTFAQNVSKLLKASGHIDDFMKKTGLSFDAVGKFMQGEPVRTTPEEAERIAAYFHADIVEMFFDGNASNFEEFSEEPHKSKRSREWESIEELLDDEIVLSKEGSLLRVLLIALKKYLKNEPNASYDTTMATLKMIKGSNFERWMGLALADIETAQPHRFKKDDILYFIAKQLYEDPDGFIINYSRSAHTTKNLIGALLAEQEKAAQKDDEA